MIVAYPCDNAEGNTVKQNDMPEEQAITVQITLTMLAVAGLGIGIVNLWKLINGIERKNGGITIQPAAQDFV